MTITNEQAGMLVKLTKQFQTTTNNGSLASYNAKSCSTSNMKVSVLSARSQCSFSPSTIRAKNIQIKEKEGLKELQIMYKLFLNYSFFYVSRGSYLSCRSVLLSE